MNESCIFCRKKRKTQPFDEIILHKYFQLTDRHFMGSPDSKICSFCYKKLDLSARFRTEILQAASLFDIQPSIVDAEVCEICNKPFKNLKIHLKTHKLTKGVCEICNREYVDLATHTRERHEDTEFCIFCEKSVAKMELHNLMYHKTQEMISADERERFADNFCGDCGKFIANLRTHQETVHKKEMCICDVCGQGPMLRISLYAHKKVHSTQFFTCDFCLREFKSRKDIKEHIEGVHMKHNPQVYCQYCPKAFYSDYFLSKHIRGVHRERSFQCGFCSKKFKNSYAKEKHERCKHTKPTDYKCRLCSAGYNSKEALSYHMETGHLEDIVYRCICHSEFYSRASYIDHQKKEHFDGNRFFCFCQPDGWKCRIKFGLHLETKHGIENARAPVQRIKRASRKGIKLKISDEDTEHFKSLVFY